MRKFLRIDSHIRVLLGVVVVLISLRACAVKTADTSDSLMGPAIEEGQVAKVVFNSGTRTLTTQRRNTVARGESQSGASDGGRGRETKKSDGARGGTIVLYPNGTIETFSLHKGWWWGPGISAGYAGDRLRVGIDAEIAWYRRWSGFVGFNMSTDFQGRGYIAGGYNIYRNSHLFAGIDTNQDILVGVRTSF